MKDTLITPLLLSQQQALTAAGWELVWLNSGWVKATHPELGETTSSFPAKGRGLKFIIIHVNKIHAAHGLTAIEVQHDVN